MMHTYQWCELKPGASERLSQKPPITILAPTSPLEVNPSARDPQLLHGDFGLEINSNCDIHATKMFSSLDIAVCVRVYDVCGRWQCICESIALKCFGGSKSKSISASLPTLRSYNLWISLSYRETNCTVTNDGRKSQGPYEKLCKYLLCKCLTETEFMTDQWTWYGYREGSS